MRGRIFLKMIWERSGSVEYDYDIIVQTVLAGTSMIGMGAVTVQLSHSPAS